MQKYRDWIEARLKIEDPLSKCGVWVEQMKFEFPELKRVRGYVMLNSGLERPHWWLVTRDGDIVDPTVSQFSGYFYGSQCRVVEYNPLDESNPPVGKCMQCGETSYLYARACSDACASKLETEMGCDFRSSPPKQRLEDHDELPELDEIELIGSI